MSNLKRNTLALAVAAGMLLPFSAMAFDITTDGNTAPEIIASQAGSAVTMTEVIQLNADGITDNLLGRTTGFGVRLIIPGVTIAGGTLTTAAGMNPPPAGNTWTVNPVAPVGGTAVWNLSPDTQTSTINAGTIINITGLSLTGAPLTGSIVATVELFDPNTNQVIASASGTIISRANGVTLTCTMGDGDTDKKIDVASDENQGAKVLFTPNGALGEIGSSLGGVGENFFNAGSVEVDITTGVTFAFQAGDAVNLSLTAPFVSAFTQAGSSVFLSTNSDCSTMDIGGSFNMANTVFNFAAFDPSTDPTFYFVCLEVPANNAVQIDAGNLTISGNFTRGSDVTAFPACNVLPLMFNGSVVKVFTFNPAGNTTAQSFLRVSNWGNTGGLVTIEGYDDGGNPGNMPITFQLPAGESVQFNSNDLENGNSSKFAGSFGDGIGRWRMVVTAEFENLRVASLNRNNNTGTVTNLTDADSNGEQVLNDSFGN